MNTVLTIARKELRDAVRSRWLVAFAATFALIALALSFVQGRSGDLGAQGFTRTTAGLVSLCLMLVPLLSLVLGANAISSERERGTLLTLLSQPVSAAEILIGKYVGLVVAVWMAIALGFGAAGLLVALSSPLTDIPHYLLFVLLSGVLASTMLSVGMFISVAAEARVRALALSILAWFVLVLFYDLGAIGVALAISSSGRTLTIATMLNPVECIRILSVMSLEPDLQILGPLGAYLDNQVGVAKTVALLSGALIAWAVVPIAGAAYLFRRQDV